MKELNIKEIHAVSGGSSADIEGFVIFIGGLFGLGAAAVGGVVAGCVYAGSAIKSYMSDKQ